MTLYRWDGKLLIRTIDGVTGLAIAEACCCDTPQDCECSSLPDTIWVVVSRTSGDFSDCAAGAFDGETAEMPQTATTPPTWEGTTPSGFTIHLECTGTTNNGDGTYTVNFSVWACDVADEADYSTTCTGSWSDPILDTNAVYPFGFTINSCGCAVGAAIDFIFYMAAPP
jgi:hypothetical protein